VLFRSLLVDLARRRAPEIILVGATSFGRELAARAAKRLGTGLTADCVDLHIDEQGRLVQTAPGFGGNLLAEIVVRRRPQMATVRPGTFQELPHDYQRGAVVEPMELPPDLPPERTRLLKSERLPPRYQALENAQVVVCGGRGMVSKKKFRNLHELARLLGGQVGATRPVVYARWVDEDALVGQAGKQIKPQVLFSLGVSGAIQHTAGIGGNPFVVAVNKNPGAVMMQVADVGLVADANQVCLALIRELKRRLRG
jgi:electron transfer flavoprotein alpha subunit